MAVLTHTHQSPSVLVTLDNLLVKLIARLHLSRCMSAALVFLMTGLLMPWLMILQVLPLTLGLGFTCLVLIGMGSVLALCFCGEK